MYRQYGATIWGCLLIGIIPNTLCSAIQGRTATLSEQINSSSDSYSTWKEGTSLPALAEFTTEMLANLPLSSYNFIPSEDSSASEYNNEDLSSESKTFDNAEVGQNTPNSNNYDLTQTIINPLTALGNEETYEGELNKPRQRRIVVVYPHYSYYDDHNQNQDHYYYKQPKKHNYHQHHHDHYNPSPSTSYNNYGYYSERPPTYSSTKYHGSSSNGKKLRRSRGPLSPILNWYYFGHL